MTLRRPILTLFALAIAIIGCVPNPTEAPPFPDGEELDRLDPDLAAALRLAIGDASAKPEESAAWFRLAKLHHANGLEDQAVIWYRYGLDLDEQEDDIWCLYALALERGGNLERAIETMQICSERHPESTPALWRQSLWLSELGRLEEASQRLDQALLIAPNDPMTNLARAKHLLVSGDAQAALELIRTLSSSPGPNRHHLSFLEASALRRLGQPDRANAILGELDDTKPVWRDPWSRDLQDSQVGIAGQRIRASVLTRSGRFAQSIPLLENILQREADDYRSWNLLGNAHYRLGQLEQATHCFSRATQINPTHFGSALNFATLLVAIRPNDPESLAQARRVGEMRPNSASAQSLLGSACLASGKLSEALTAFERVALLANDPAVSIVQASLVEIRLGRVDAARQRIESLTPRSANRMLGESALLSISEQPKPANEVFDRAVAAGADRQLARMVRKLIDDGVEK